MSLLALQLLSLLPEPPVNITPYRIQTNRTMPARIKTTTTELESRNAFEKTVDDIATLQLKIEADTALHNEQKAHADKLFKAQLKRDQAKLQQKLVACEMYAKHHREELLSDKQTAETKFSFFGYRKSPGVLKTLNSRWTLAKALQSLKEAGHTACSKITESLDKQAVKRLIPESELPKYGLRMEYKEDFWIEPKRAATTPEKRISA